MKQLGNLAVICAQRPELLLQLRDGLVSVQAKNRAAMEHSPRKGWCKKWNRVNSREYGN